MSNPFSNTTQVNAVIRVRRGTDAERLNPNTTLDVGELMYSTDKKRLYVGDGTSDESIDGGILVGNKVWFTDNFLNLGQIQKYDLVYRSDTSGFYMLTGSMTNDPASYVLVGGLKALNEVGSYTLTPATANLLGGIKVKTGLSVESDGSTSVSIDSATLSIVNNKITVKNPYNGTNEPPPVKLASYVDYGSVKLSQLSGIIVDNGILGLNLDNRTVKLSSTVNGSILYVDSNNVIPQATSTTLGGIKLGDGLSANQVTGKVDVKPELLSSFGALLSSNGYQKFPSGLITQWGILSSVSLDQTFYLVNFPITFPNKIFNVIATLEYDAAVTGSIGTVVKGLSTIGFYVAGDNSSSSTTGNVYWQAIGN